MAVRLFNLEDRVYQWVLEEGEYADLKERSDWLAALEAAGVDNWEGYEVAIQISNGEDVY